jgi:uncharacterized membrane protein (DUF2068 family)
MKRLRTAAGWARWEFSRRIDVTLGVKLIIIDRSIKTVVLTGGGIALIVATRAGFIDRLTLEVQRQLNLNAANHLLLRLAHDVLDAFGSLGRTGQYTLGVAAIMYGLLEGFEALGLLRRRRWAEYLVLLATLAFIPLEVDEILSHATPIKLLALAVNIAIVVYLVYRKRLFLERRTGSEADDRSLPA